MTARESLKKLGLAAALVGAFLFASNTADASGGTEGFPPTSVWLPGYSHYNAAPAINTTTAVSDVRLSGRRDALSVPTSGGSITGAGGGPTTSESTNIGFGGGGFSTTWSGHQGGLPGSTLQTNVHGVPGSPVILTAVVNGQVAGVVASGTIPSEGTLSHRFELSDLQTQMLEGIELIAIVGEPSLPTTAEPQRANARATARR